MKRSILLSAALMLLLTGCGAGSANVQTQPVQADLAPQTSYDAGLDTAQADFSLRLLQQTAEQYEGQNMLISPYSVMQALSMTANGAAGETLSQMEQVLGGMPAAELSSALGEQRRNLPDDNGAKCKIANSIWVREDEAQRILPDFLKKVQADFDAEAYCTPFDDAAADALNKWCSKHTDKMIPKLIDRFAPDEVMYLINAACFDAKWQEKYEKPPQDEIFTASGGTEQTVQMMHSEESLYLEDQHATGFIKPYHGGSYAFVALLPEKGMTPEKYLAKQTPESLQKVLNNAESCTVHAALPQFSYDFETDFAATLQTMGMQDAFTEDADFSNMADDELHISKVIHKTHIDVDADGTKAAAISAVVMEKKELVAVPDAKYVRLDRPFVYMIVETEHMTPIFSGVFNTKGD